MSSKETNLLGICFYYWKIWTNRFLNWIHLKMWTNRFLVDFISPRVSHFNHSDITINSIILNDFILVFELNSFEFLNLKLCHFLNFKKMFFNPIRNVSFSISFLINFFHFHENQIKWIVKYSKSCHIHVCFIKESIVFFFFFFFFFFGISCKFFRWNCSFICFVIFFFQR